MTPTYRLHLGDCIDVLRSMEEGDVGAFICDPPYGLEFQGHEWDKLSKSNGFRRKDNPADVGRDSVHGRTSATSPEYMAGVGKSMQANHESWLAEVYRVLPPGGVVKAFSGTRTYHRLAAAMDAVGFEDVKLVAWAYGSGFPKSLDISKAFDKRSEDAAKRFEGWGTALKPSWEPVLIGRKPQASRIDSVLATLQEAQITPWDPGIFQGTQPLEVLGLKTPALNEAILRAVESSPVLPLHPLLTKECRLMAPCGGGVYLLYYRGSYRPYRVFTEANLAAPGSVHCYYGKSNLPGNRTGNDRTEAKALFNRLHTHAISLSEVTNLEPEDFDFRFVVCLEPGGPRLVEDHLKDLLPALWNHSLCGFGNQSLGSGRKNSRRSDWDTLHPGRAHLEKQGIPLDLERQRKLEERVDSGPPKSPGGFPLYDYTTPLRRNPEPYWHNDTQWVCPRHVPSSLISHDAPKCWYKGCGSVRPARTGAKAQPPAEPVTKVKEAKEIKARKPTPPKPPRLPTPVVVVEPPKAVPQVAVAATVPDPPKPPKAVKAPKTQPVTVEGGPSEADRRRGATTSVPCTKCGTLLWRRPNEIDGRSFRCKVCKVAH